MMYFAQDNVCGTNSLLMTSQTNLDKYDPSTRVFFAIDFFHYKAKGPVNVENL